MCVRLLTWNEGEIDVPIDETAESPLVLAVSTCMLSGTVVMAEGERYHQYEDVQG